jgi:hypothetical protein
VGSVSPANGAPPPAPRGPLRVRQCHVETTSSPGARLSSVADATFGADAAGNVVEIRVKAGDVKASIDRDYDPARRFISERRRFTSPDGEVLSTFTWQRDQAGNVIQAERAEESRGGTSPRPGRRFVAKVTQRHATGRWLRRETRDPEALLRTETRTFDVEGRVATLEVETAARGTKPGETTLARFTYVGHAAQPSRERTELLVPGGSPLLRRDIDYDEKGRITVDHVWRSDHADPEEEGAWTHTYDAAGRIVSKMRGDGLRGDSFAYSGDCPADLEDLLEEPRSAKD